jgi:hypothetical protein
LHTRTPRPFICSKKLRLFTAAHEDDDFHRLDVGAGGDHVHGDGHAGVVAGAEVFDELLGAGAAALGAAVGDLLRELVAAAKLFAQDFDNLFGVVVVFGKDEGLGQLGAGGEHVGVPAVAQGAHHGADLVGRLHGAVQLFGLVFKVVVQLPGGLAAGGFVLRFQPVAFVDLGALLAHLGADAVHVVVDVHAIGHGLGVAVFHDQVLVEEAKGLLVGRGGQADQVRVKVLQHLAPQVVDAAVGLVGDHNVKALDGDGRVVANGLGVFEQVSIFSVDSSSASSASSRPLSMLNMRWMVQMTTRA